MYVITSISILLGNKFFAMLENNDNPAYVDLQMFYYISSTNKNGTSRSMRCVSVATKRHYLIKTNAAFHHIKTRHVRIGSLSKGNCHRCFFAKVNWVQGYTKRNYLVTLKDTKKNI